MRFGLDLTASYAAGATAGPLGKWVNGAWVTSVDGGYSDALSMIRKVTLPTWNLSVTLSYPIGNSAQEAGYARSKVQYEQTRLGVVQAQNSPGRTERIPGTFFAFAGCEPTNVNKVVDEILLAVEQGNKKHDPHT